MLFLTMRNDFWEMGEAPVRVQVRTLQSCSVVTFSQLAGQSVVGGSSALRERERDSRTEWQSSSSSSSSTALSPVKTFGLLQLQHISLSLSLSYTLTAQLGLDVTLIHLVVTVTLKWWWVSSGETMMSSYSKLHTLLILQKCSSLTRCSVTNYKAPGNAKCPPSPVI